MVKHKGRGFTVEFCEVTRFSNSQRITPALLDANVVHGARLRRTWLRDVSAHCSKTALARVWVVCSTRISY